MILSEWSFILKTKCLSSICEVQNTVPERETENGNTQNKQVWLPPSCSSVLEETQTKEGTKASRVRDLPASSTPGSCNDRLKWGHPGPPDDSADMGFAASST